MSRSVAAAAWVAAVSLIVIAGIVAYVALFQPSWVEYEACLHANGYVAQGDSVENEFAKGICAGE